MECNAQGCDEATDEGLATSHKELVPVLLDFGGHPARQECRTTKATLCNYRVKVYKETWLMRYLATAKRATKKSS